jgi:hypothetical protein
MLPSSDELEQLHARAKHAWTVMKKKGAAEISQTQTKESLAQIARDWLRLSPSIRQADLCAAAMMASFDEDMQALLSGTTTRTRANTFGRRLERFVVKAVDQLIVPLIPYEGSPRQVAARQIQTAFPPGLSAEETAYVEEASRCVTVQAFRAAMIMLWAAGIARMHRAIANRGFNAYNAAVDACVSRKGPPFNKVRDGAKVTSLPELQRSRDADVLIVGLELFGYDLQGYQELDRLLGTRNDAAHPGQFEPTALDVQQFAHKVGQHIFQGVRA